MSDEEKGNDVAPEENSDAVTQEVETPETDGPKEQSVKFETYDKVMKRLKSREAELEKERELRSRFEQEKLEAEGNKDQLIESLKKEIMEHKTKLKTTVGSVARSQAMNAIVEEAVKTGCNSPDVVKKFLEDEIGSLEFDENFNPDREQVKALIEEARQRAPILFSKDAPKVASHNISTGGGSSGPKKSLKKMKMDELMNIWAQANAKN